MGFEPMTLRTKGFDSTNRPPCPTHIMLNMLIYTLNFDTLSFLCCILKSNYSVMATYCQFPKSTLKHSFLYSILRIRTLITRKKKSLKETRLKRNYLTPLHRDSDRRHRWSSIAAERHEHAPATVDPQSVDDEAKHHSMLLAASNSTLQQKKKKIQKFPKEKKEKNPKR